VIQKIVIEGNRALEEETVRSFIGSKEGAELDPDQVTADIHALYGSGFVEDVVVETRWLEGGGRPELALVFIIKEKPMIREVRFEGVKKINEDDLKKISDLKAR
jgi:outer membrane protein insertion porin family